MTERRTIPCYCEYNVEIDVPDEVDLSTRPSIRDEIVAGNFLSALCPNCGKLLKPEFAVRIIDSSRNMEILLVPELERSAFLLGKSQYRLRDAVSGRVAIGYPELVEKLLVFEAGLDDRVVELIKFYLAQKTDGSQNLQIYFREKAGDRIVFHLFGLKADEVGVSRVPFSLYEKLQKELPERLQESPYDAMLAPPYVSFQKAGAEEET